MIDLTQQFFKIRSHIEQYNIQYHSKKATTLLAVSKGQSTESISRLYQCSQRDFAESYLNEALAKISACNQQDINWHFIGALQSNKIPLIAQHFSWVQTVSRLKEAKMLSEYRTATQLPLNICIQVKLDKNPTRGGVALDEVEALLLSIVTLPRLKIRGLMCLPPFSEDFEEQRHYFNQVRQCYDACLKKYDLDTLSMGMSQDFKAAIAEGATMVRIGTLLFGKRED